MSPMTSARFVPRTTAAVWWSISAIVTRTVDLVAEHDLAERIADEDHRDAGLVEDPRGREVVRGEHRDALAVGVHPARCRRRSGGGRLLGCAHADSAPACGSIAGPVCAAASRASNARATRSRIRSATSRFDSSGSSSRAPSAIEDRDPVRVGPEAGARLGDVVGDEQVDALRRSLSAARSRLPVSAANPTRTGGVDGRASCSPCCRPRRSGDLGEQVRRRLELERQALAARDLAFAVARRREVGDGGGHDQGVDAARPSCRRHRVAAARRAARRSSRRGTTSAPSGSGTSTAAGDQRHPAPRGRAPPRRSRRPSSRSSGCRCSGPGRSARACRRR